MKTSFKNNQTTSVGSLISTFMAYCVLRFVACLLGNHDKLGDKQLRSRSSIYSSCKSLNLREL